MDFLLNDDQKRLKEQVIWLCEDTLSTLEGGIGETNIALREIASALARVGLLRLLVPREYGIAGMLLKQTGST
jgi:alkylation response protein AidB-like acyl-CoA dehydrogenase